MIHARYKNFSFWKCELKPSEHACKIFFNYSKPCVISYFEKKVQSLLPKHVSQCFRTNSRNIISRNASMVIPLQANQDLTPVLAPSYSSCLLVPLQPPVIARAAEYCVCWSLFVISRDICGSCR